MNLNGQYGLIKEHNLMVEVNDKIMDEKLEQFIKDCDKFSARWEERFPLVYTKLPEVRECLTKIIERYEGLAPEEKQSEQILPGSYRNAGVLRFR